MSRARDFPLWEQESATSGYLVGTLLGDGSVCLSRDGHHGYVALEATDCTFVDTFRSALSQLAPPGTHVAWQGPFETLRADPDTGKQRAVRLWRTQVSSVAFVRGLRQRYGSFSTRSWSAEKFLSREPSDEAIGSLLAGIFDSDGSLSVNSNRAQIRITSTNRDGLVSLAAAAQRIGLGGSVVENGGKRRNWALLFGRADTVAVFAKRCGSAHWRRKVERFYNDLCVSPRDPLGPIPSRVTTLPLDGIDAERTYSREDIRSIAALKGVEVAAVTAALVDVGIDFRPARAWKPADIERVLSLYRDGEKVSSIASSFGRTSGAIEHLVSRQRVRRRWGHASGHASLTP